LVMAAEDSAEDPEPWVLPAPLTDRTGALAAIQRTAQVFHAATDALAWPAIEPDDSTRPRIYHGTYEHASLRAVAVATADRHLLAVAAHHLERAASGEDVSGGPEDRKRHADLAELLDQIAGGEARRTTSALIIQPVTRISRLVNLRPNGDSELLTGLVRASAISGDDIALTLDQAAAYMAMATRINEVLTGGDPLIRWAY